MRGLVSLAILILVGVTKRFCLWGEGYSLVESFTILYSINRQFIPHWAETEFTEHNTNSEKTISKISIHKETTCLLRRQFRRRDLSSKKIYVIATASKATQSFLYSGDITSQKDSLFEVSLHSFSNDRLVASNSPFFYIQSLLLQLVNGEG
jgi:hypothetical protein